MRPARAHPEDSHRAPAATSGVLARLSALAVLLPVLTSGPGSAEISLGARVAAVDPGAQAVRWTIDEFEGPIRVRALDGEALLVADFASSSAVALSSPSEIEWRIRGNNPHDVRVAGGRIVVVHNGNSRIGVYDRDGVLLVSVDEGLDHPTGALLTAEETLIVSDTRNGRIVELTLEGAVLRERAYRRPMSVEPMPDGGLLVADRDSGLVEILDAAWQPVRTLRGFGAPTDAKPNRAGHLMVAEYGEQRVVEVDLDGTVLQAVELDRPPLSVDVLDSGLWLIAVGREVPKRPRTTDRLVTAAGGEAPQESGAGRRLVVVALVAAAAALLAFRMRRLLRRAERTVRAWLAPVWARRRRLGLAAALVAVLAALLFAAVRDRTARVVLDCAAGELCELTYEGSPLAEVPASSLSPLGSMRVSLSKEFESRQALQEVVLTERATGRVTRYDLRREEDRAAWSYRHEGWQASRWRGLVARGRSESVELHGLDMPVQRVEVVVRDPASLAVALRTTGGLRTEVTMRPAVHGDGSVRFTEGPHAAAVKRAIWPGRTPLAQTCIVLGGLVDGALFAALIVLLAAAGSLVVFALVSASPSAGDRETGVGRDQDAVEGAFARPSRRFAIGIAILLLALAGWTLARSASVADDVLERMPHTQDEVSYLFQAKQLAAGRLAAKSLPEPYRRFFDHEFIINNGRWFGLHQPGTSILLAIGLACGAFWLANPVVGALTVVVLFLGAKAWFGTRAGVLSALAFVASPWPALMSGTLMSHPLALLLVCVAIWALARGRAHGPLAWWLLLGASMGGLALVRPPDALALAICVTAVGLLDLGRAWLQGSGAEASGESRERPGAWRRATAVLRGPGRGYAAAALVCLLGAAAFELYNRGVTGDSEVSPYESYSPHLKYGFNPHAGIEWGRGHSREQGARNLWANISAADGFLFAAPSDEGGRFDRWVRSWFWLWVVALGVAGFLLRRRAAAVVMVALILSFIGVYFFWFHKGLAYGPRFYYPLLAPIVLLIGNGAVGIAAAARRLATLLLPRAVPGSRPDRALAVLLPAMLLLPLWLPASLAAGDEMIESHRGFRGLSRDDLNTVERAGLEHAIVFVDSRSSWVPYGRVFWSQSSDLDDPVIYARDGGMHNVKTRRGSELDNDMLLDLFPGRSLYRLRQGRLEPLHAGAGAERRSPGPQDTEDDRH